MKRMHTDREIRAMAVDAVEQNPDLEVFEHIVDADGHKRFVEGDITMETISGVTQTYGKWSLSGSHLMIVLAGTIENGTALALATWVSDVGLPAWIMSKIVPVFAGNVSINSVTLADDSWGTQTGQFTLKKATVGDVTTVQINFVSTLTLTSTKSFRAQFDLLIDNE